MCWCSVRLAAYWSDVDVGRPLSLRYECALAHDDTVRSDSAMLCSCGLRGVCVLGWREKGEKTRKR
jgi:hypothetical protein